MLITRRRVEAYVASWIEMLKSAFSGSMGSVEAYVASWIEILNDNKTIIKPSMSRLT